VQRTTSSPPSVLPRLINLIVASFTSAGLGGPDPAPARSGPHPRQAVLRGQPRLSEEAIARVHNLNFGE